MPKVILPSALQTVTHGVTETQVAGNTVEEVILALEEQFPGIRARLCEADGSVRKFINLFLNDEDIRAKAGLTTPVVETDRLQIVPAVSGGAI